MAITIGQYLKNVTQPKIYQELKGAQAPQTFAGAMLEANAVAFDPDERINGVSTSITPSGPGKNPSKDPVAISDEAIEALEEKIAALEAQILEINKRNAELHDALEAENTPSPIASGQPYHIDSHLDIDTAKPDIYDALLDIFPTLSSTTGEVHLTPGEYRDAFLQKYPDPLNKILDDDYRHIVGRLENLADLEAHISRLDDRETKEYLAEYEQTLADARLLLGEDLAALKRKYETLGASDYAQEVFSKRGLKELGVAVDLEGLYDTFADTMSAAMMADAEAAEAA